MTGAAVFTTRRETCSGTLRLNPMALDAAPPLSVGEGLAETFPTCEAVKAVPELIGEKRGDASLPYFRELVRALPSADSRTLIVRLETTTDPLLLWAMHCELDRRGIPPCLRWPSCEASQQAEFLTWLADILWFCKRNTHHRPPFRGWQGLFKHLPASTQWHKTAHRQYLFVSSRYSLAHWCAKGLALAESDRQQLMMHPTNAMRAERRQLQPEKFAAIRERVVAAAMAKPDRAARHDPGAVADRRLALWRVFVLLGRNQTATANYWELLTGNTLTRQAVSKQLGMVRDVLD